MSNDAIFPTYRRWPVEFVSGSGATLVDTQGRSYIDLVAGIAVCSVGHAHPKVAAAVSDQVNKLVHVSNLYETAPQKLLASRLAELTGGKLSFFANSGAEAIECALKLARKWGKEAGKSRIVAADGGFHGRTLGALSATGQPAKQAPFEPLLVGFEHVPYGDAGALEQAMDDDVAAVLLEPIQGEAGVIVPPDDYLKAARALCDQWGALLMLDEVQTGLARTGKWFGYEHFDIVPDVMCLAKALAGGLPMGACLATPEVAAAFAVGDHGSTFGGGPVQSAAALAVLDVIADEDLVARSEQQGRRARDALARIAPGEVRGRGLLIGIDMGRPIAREVAARALEKGVLVNDATDSVVRLVPPLVITDEEMDKGLDVLAEVFHEV
jgi:acetylornithine/N-succinyldiaminopimelate aminotransferase